MLDNIPTDREVLRKWLRAGYVKNGINYPTRKGTPQVVISPTLSNMTLDGMEQAVIRAVPRLSWVNLVRYADDFIVTGKSKRILETMVKPAIDFRFYSSGGSFCIKISYADTDRNNVYFRKETELKKLKASQTTEQFRLGAERQGAGYQTRMNAVLRMYMEAHNESVKSDRA